MIFRSSIVVGLCCLSCIIAFPTRAKAEPKLSRLYLHNVCPNIVCIFGIKMYVSSTVDAYHILFASFLLLSTLLLTVFLFLITANSRLHSFIILDRTRRLIVFLTEMLLRINALFIHSKYMSLSISVNFYPFYVIVSLIRKFKDPPIFEWKSFPYPWYYNNRKGDCLWSDQPVTNKVKGKFSI